MAKAILFVNQKKERAKSLAVEILKDLESRGMEAESFNFEKKSEPVNRDDYSIAFSLGGDGTVLYTARTMAPLGVPVFPINLGTLGFISGVRPENWKSVFEAYLSGKAKLSRRLMLEAKLSRRGSVVFSSCCLNDFVISASGIAKIINLSVSAGHEEGAEFAPLGRYRADGLIVATPTGSTAYSVAAGGPIVDPELEALILNPICPFALSGRPMVLPSGEPLLIEVEQEQRSGVLLTVDGQVTEHLEPGDKIFISPSTTPVTLIASGRTVFYEALKTKLSWMGG
ncbi:NAD(+)/NADH kinase [Leadbettera azotonutricia]|uniref:NAD kinase n=1 Tax=Leadbettera azotonutricia (strain ATCC BAA-888 / DSM 13862 / ZAS-9) TaxID=545695 RepID=F5Y9K9_LEAAZ|nr:NAD(+)/NADH kinase [Leadbettera azotonutricia]AEF81418.1 putative inorganic polyphosphate/ATP-NAD kinase [Leadbettera azotonutricia ZAS-9]